MLIEHLGGFHHFLISFCGRPEHKICLDADFQKVREVILKLYESRLAEANPNIEKDPKTLKTETGIVKY